MDGQGCSSDASISENSLLDRIAGLQKIISPELVRQALRNTGKESKRACLLTNEVMVWVVLAMCLFTQLPIRQVFKVCRRLRRGEATPCRSSLCMARQRLGSEALVELYKLVVRPLATPQTPGAFYRGFRKVGVDGTILNIPESEENQSFGRTSGSRGKSAFPQLRKVSLVELGTHVEFAFVFGGCNDSERKLVVSLWEHLPKDALLIQDRGFYSYEHWKTLTNKCKLLTRIQKSMVFHKLESFEDGSFLAKVYRSHWYRERDQNGCLVRVIEYKLNDGQRTGHKEIHRLITNLLDAERYPAMELIMEYHERWEEELVFDEQKTHQDPRRAEKTTNLRSATVDGVKQELYALSLAHFVTRATMLDAATHAGIDVDRISFKGAFEIIKTRLPECDVRDQKSIVDWYENLIWEISRERNPPRRNRINPRVIKQKMSRWMKCQPKHRKLKKMTKTFADSVVMLN